MMKKKSPQPFGKPSNKTAKPVSFKPPAGPPLSATGMKAHKVKSVKARRGR